jgi:hypothetical protein
MYWHVQHDDHVYSGEDFQFLANDEKHAAEIVAKHNAELDRLTAFLRSFMGERVCEVHADGHIMSPIESIEAFMKRERKVQDRDLQQAFDSLTSWLLDNTEEAFEEEMEIDEARQAIIDKMEEVR